MTEPILYPGAIWTPLLGHSMPGTLAQRNTVVLHITDGTTARGAMATFSGSKAPNRVSAHFVVDRDGKVYQLISIAETAWHASQANSHSIGIEHVALSAAGAKSLNAAWPHLKSPYVEMLATEEQYAASAQLVRWCCEQRGVPVDRAHVRTHNEASPRDGHVLCCTGALDPDRVVRMAGGVL